MSTLRKKLGQAVKRLRRDAGYSQESFADACHLHRTYIGSVERAEINISLENIERIARVLKLPVSQLFAEAELERVSEAPQRARSTRR